MSDNSTPATQGENSSSRRNFLRTSFAATAAVAAAAPLAALAQSGERYLPGAAPIRYPDPDIIPLDRRFRYKVGNAGIEKLYTGTRWAEGPAWNGASRFLLWSDVAGNRQLRYLDENNSISEQYRSPTNYGNGNTFDLQGRQITCQSTPPAVVRYENDGTVTTLASTYNGVSLNAPNDVIVNPLDGSIWFTDPGYGSMSLYEGSAANNKSPQPFQKEAVYRIDGNSGKLEKLTDDIYKPNGLCFSADYKKLYVADSGVSHYPKAKSEIKVWDVDGKKVKNGRSFTSMTYKDKTGIADGIRCDADGNIWAASGWAGEGYDGVQIFAPNGDRIGQIVLPEICANLCFGGEKRNRLFMAASQSLYAVYVGVKGAHFC